MSNIRFILRAQGKASSIITLHVSDSRFRGRRFRYSTGKTIDAHFWLKKKQRAKVDNQNAVSFVLLNDHLDRIIECVTKFLSSKHGSKTIVSDDLRKKLDNLMLDEEQELKIKQAEELENEILKLEKENGFYELWKTIIKSTKTKDGLPITDSTKTTKCQTLNLIKEYAAKTGKKITFEDFDMNFYRDLDEYMIDKGFLPNTRGKHFKEIKAILHEAEDRDIQVNTAFRKKSFKVIRVESDSIFLTESDLRKLLYAKVTPSKEKLRDIFIMACYTGQRHSDWAQIRKENMIVENGKEILKISQQKGKKIIHLPVHPIVKSILNKYGDALPKVVSSQKFNDALKDIGEKAELGNISLGRTIVKKSSEISTHTARRSFATNAYLSKSMQVYEIMNCTGHKTESSFLKYLKLGGLDYAKLAAESKFFNDSELLKLKIA